MLTSVRQTRKVKKFKTRLVIGGTDEPPNAWENAQWKTRASGIN